MDENDIFKNQKEMVQNLRDSAENLGINPDAVARNPEEPAKPQQVLVAKKNCKKCWGQGAFIIAGHDVAVKTKVKNNYDSLHKPRGKFKMTNGRNSSKPEPTDKAKAVIYCSCVKMVRVGEAMQTT